MPIQNKIRTVLASLDLGLAVEELDFLGNIIEEDQIVIFRTQEDTRVDDVICLPQEGDEYSFDDPQRPALPDDTHPNCRCYWEDKESGADIGQDGIFATGSLIQIQSAKDTFEGKEGAWKTVKGNPVFFPDGEDPKDVIDKAFKNKPKTKKPKEKESTVERKPISKDEHLENENNRDELISERVSQQGTWESNVARTDPDKVNIPPEELKAHMMKRFGLSDRDASRQIVELDAEALGRYKSSYIQESMNGDIDKRFYTNGDRKEQQRKFDVLLKNNKDHSLFKSYEFNEEQATIVTQKHKEAFESAPSFYRGTSTLELDHYGDTTQLGGDKNGYKYVATTTDPTQARSFSGGVIVEYEGDSIRKSGKPVEYVAKPIVLGQSKSVNTSEAIGKPMNIKFSNEKEVRVRETVSIQQGSPNGVKIKNIFVLKDAEGDLKYSPATLEKITGAKVHILEGDFHDVDVFKEVLKR